MSISVAVRPRQQAYLNAGSPPIPVYTYWNAAWNPIVYEFAVPTDVDRLSSLFIQIYELGTNTLLAANTYRPFQSGNFILDVSPYLRAYLFSKYQPDFTKINSIDNGNAIRFYITYTQTSEDGGTVILNSEQPYPITASCSAMQFGDSDNGNMNRYVPLNFPIDEIDKAGFLTAFESPVMFNGYPFTLSFIYDASLGGHEVYANIEEQDINNSQLIDYNSILDPSCVKKINYLLVPQPTQPNTKNIEVYLHTGNTINDYYVDEGYVDNGYQQIL